MLVLAFAEAETRGLYSAIELLRGFAIQLGYRWALGTVVCTADDKAVLLWTPTSRQDPSLRGARKAWAAVVAVSVGLALFAISNVLLLVPLTLALRALGVSEPAVAVVRLAIVAVRLMVTLVRALRAFRHDLWLSRRLPPTQARRWSLDYMAALPARAGHGSAVLRTFLRQADEAGAEVVLHCEPSVAPFYARHGFRVAPGDQAPFTQVVMRRRVPRAPGGRAGARQPRTRLSARNQTAHSAR